MRNASHLIGISGALTGFCGCLQRRVPPSRGKAAYSAILFGRSEYLGNFLRSLALPDGVGHWSLTTLREKLIKIGAKAVRHGLYITFQMGRSPPPELCLSRFCA